MVIFTLHNPTIEKDRSRDSLDRDSCPINSLPPELLALIFQCGVSENWKGAISTCFLFGHSLYYGPTSSDEVGTPEVGGGKCLKQGRARGSLASRCVRLSFSILVSHVCRYWRDVAIPTASLWTKITLSDTFRIYLSRRSAYELVASHLERSQGLPIDVDWELAFPELCSLLTPHAHRWRSIDIDFQTYECMLAFLEAASQPSIPAAAQLTKLQLYCNGIRLQHPDPTRLEDIKHLPLFGGSAPYLETISLWGVPVDWNQSWISSASHLTCLQLAFHRQAGDEPSWAEFTTLLHGASKLRELGLSFSGPRSNEIVSPHHIIYLPNLTHLTLRRENPIGVLGKLRTPSLLSLDLRSCAVFDNSSLEKPHLGSGESENFEQYTHPYSMKDVEEVYSRLQNLKSLRLRTPREECYPLAKFLRILRSPLSELERHAILLPSLERMHVTTLYRPHTIHKIVQERKKAGYPLKSLYLGCEEGLPVSDDQDDTGSIRWFKDNVEQFGYCQSIPDYHMTTL